MTGVTDKELDDYFKEARRFDQDRVLSAIRSRRLAWTIAIAAMSTTGLAMLAIAGLTPFKTVVPYVIRVDNSTGIVEVMNGLSDGRESYEDAVTKWYAARYVSAREGFVLSEAQENFKTVSLMSQADEQQRFSVAYSGRNPESPQAQYGRSATARVAFKSISLISREVVQVRYLKTVTRGDEAKTTHWVATMTFAYVNAQVSPTDRLTNPLGFVVSVYRSDPEGQH